MKSPGFTIVELLVVMAVVVSLLAMGTLQFNSFTRKTNIEKQVRTMYADLLNARAEALLQKRNRSFTVTNGNFSVYSSANATGTPIRQTTLKYPVEFDNTNTVSFNSRGMASGTKTICVSPAGNPATVDSLVITETMIQLGQRTAGGCASGNITAR